MQNKRFYAVLVLAAGIVLAALHVADLLQWMDASTGFALQGSVWARYLPWLAALALPYLPARRVAAQQQRACHQHAAAQGQVGVG